MENLLDSTWSDSVASDPKHRPQFFDRPATTVRKEWGRRPQEAHIADGKKYRRLSVEEIAIIQGFTPSWVDVDGLTENQKIGLLGNAVPPPVSEAIGAALQDSGFVKTQTYLEICAGIGGLSLGFPYLEPLEKIEMWDAACKVLRERFPEGLVFEGTAQSYDFTQHKGKVGLLCGGPPCQPWSQAGTRKGADDPRDVMGFTPNVIADCLPEVYIFENVPGLLSSKEHEDYREHLFDRLRNPAPGVEYGLDYKILNAADFGVPQVRKRVFLVGVLAQPDSVARRFLQNVLERTTHHDPKKPAYMKQPWVNLREALAGLENNEPWRKWNTAASKYSDEIVEVEDEKAETEETQKTVSNPSQDFNRIGFWWPKREQSLKFDGQNWAFVPRETSLEKRALLVSHEEKVGSGKTAYAVGGDYCDALEALAAIVKGSVKFVYWDMPILDSDSDFVKHTEAGFSRSAWLSLMYDVTSNLNRCLAPDSFVAIHTDEDSVHYARNVLDEVFGYHNHITTFAWEKKYAPQNDRNTPTDSFDYIVVYSTMDRASISTKLGLTVEETKLIDDGDPRGSYTAGHKGARSGNEKSKFKVNMPPYRWRLVKADLPDCKYHFFDETTGVLMMQRVREAGSYSIDIECLDSKDTIARTTYQFEIEEGEDGIRPWSDPTDIHWLNADRDGVTEGGPLKIENKKVAHHSVEDCHSIIFAARGGTPFKGKSNAPGAGRYWEFSYSTLVRHIVGAAASFGKKGMSLPSQKKFVRRGETTKKISVRNWLPWSVGGKSEDGTRHLKNLANAGFGKSMSQSHAKPEALGFYLLRVFASGEDDTILTIGDNYGMMTSAAMKYGRSSFHFIGPTATDVAYWSDTAAPRMQAVLEGKDEWGLSAEDDFSPAPAGRLVVLQLSKSKIEKRSWTDIALVYDEEDDYRAFVAGLRGFYERDEHLELFRDMSGNPCVVIEPSEYLDEIVLSELEGLAPAAGFLTVLYEKSCLNEEASVHPDIRLIRVPFEVM